MNILIKDMDMPQNCYFCWLGHKCPKYESLLWNEINKKRKADCPLVEVPPHGRLIDANKLKEEFPHDEDWDYPVNTNNYVVETIDKSPTIIEADMNSFIHIFEEDDEEDGMDSFIRILKD